MNWKGCGRKRFWSSFRYYPTFSRKDREGQWAFSGKVTQEILLIMAFLDINYWCKWCKSIYFLSINSFKESYRRISEWCSIQYTKIGGRGGIPHRCQFVGSICKKFFESAERYPFFRQSNLRDEPCDVDVEQTYGDHIRQHHEDPNNVGSGKSAATCKIILPWNTEPNCHTSIV